MSAAFKWLLSPLYLVWLAIMFAGFLLIILVDEGPRAAWLECREIASALVDDVKSFFGKA